MPGEQRLPCSGSGFTLIPTRIECISAVAGIDRVAPDSGFGRVTQSTVQEHTSAPSLAEPERVVPGLGRKRIATAPERS